MEQPEKLPIEGEVIRQAEKGGPSFDIRSLDEYKRRREYLLADASRSPLPITFKGEGPELAEERAVEYYKNRLADAKALAVALESYRNQHPEEFLEKATQ
jgi:hypothetical protein